MKYITLLLLCSLILLPCQAQAGYYFAAASGGGGGFTPDLIDEDCEGTGTPSGWVNTGSPDWDHATSPAPLAGGGAQSLQINGSDSTYKEHTPASTAEYYFLLHFTTLPSTESTVIFIQTAGAGSTIYRVRVDNAGNIGLRTNATTTNCVTTITTGVTYHVWLRNAASSTCTLAFSTDGTRPSSGNNFASQTGVAGSAGRFNITVAGSDAKIMDNIMASTTSIPSNP